LAQAKTVRGTKILVKIGDGGSPEAFTHNCSFNGARSLQFSAQTNDTNVPDCDDPDLIAWVEREKVSLSAQIQGAGTYNTPDGELFFDYMKSPDGKNVRFVIDVAGANGGCYWFGEFLATEFSISGDRGQKGECQVTLLSNGEVDRADLP